MNLPINDEQKMNEIIFANRNKRYGAYAIRASYNSAVTRALTIVSSSVLLFSALAYILNRHQDEIEHLITPNEPIVYKSVPIDIEPKTPPAEKPKSNPPSGNKNNSNTNAPLITDSVADNHTPDALNSDNPVNTPNGGDGPQTPGGPGTGDGTGTIPTFTIAPPPAEPVTFVDESAEFEGGYNALLKFIRENTIYPTLAREAGIEGTVYVSFVVDEKGKVASVKIQRGVGGGCSEEAARVISKLPDFKKPGKLNGQTVKSWYTVPISFKLK